MTTDIFVPNGYVTQTFWPTALSDSNVDNPDSVKMVDIQPFTVYQEDHPHNLKKRGSHYGTMPRCRANVSESLDLVRKVLQPAINHDIIEVFKKYLSVFRDASENVNSNMQTEPFSKFANNDDIDIDKMVHKLCCDALDHCKTLFELTNPGVKTSKQSISPTAQDSPASEISPKVISSLPNRSGIKRVPSPDFPWTKRLIRKPARRSLSPSIRPTKRGRSNTSNRYGSPIRRIQPPKHENRDPNRLTSDTEFIMGTKANRALGLGATRGRIYAKHPNLFKYTSDSEDKKWMVENKCMASTGGKKTFILIADDIFDLLDNEYKDSPHVVKEEMQVFRLPEFILRKMRTLMSKQTTSHSEPSPNASINSELINKSTDSIGSNFFKSSYRSPSPDEQSKNLPSTIDSADVLMTVNCYEDFSVGRATCVNRSDTENSSDNEFSGSDFEHDAVDQD